MVRTRRRGLAGGLGRDRSGGGRRSKAFGVLSAVRNKGRLDFNLCFVFRFSRARLFSLAITLLLAKGSGVATGA